MTDKGFQVIVLVVNIVVGAVAIAVIVAVVEEVIMHDAEGILAVGKSKAEQQHYGWKPLH